LSLSLFFGRVSITFHVNPPPTPETTSNFLSDVHLRFDHGLTPSQLDPQLIADHHTYVTPLLADFGLPSGIRSGPPSGMGVNPVYSAGGRGDTGGGLDRAIYRAGGGIDTGGGGRGGGNTGGGVDWGGGDTGGGLDLERRPSRPYPLLHPPLPPHLHLRRTFHSTQPVAFTGTEEKGVAFIPATVHSTQPIAFTPGAFHSTQPPEFTCDDLYSAQPPSALTRVALHTTQPIALTPALHNMQSPAFTPGALHSTQPQASSLGTRHAPHPLPFTFTPEDFPALALSAGPIHSRKPLPFTANEFDEKHSHTTAHHPVVKPPAEVSTAVSHTPTQHQGWGNYQELSCSLAAHDPRVNPAGTFTRKDSPAPALSPGPIHSPPPFSFTAHDPPALALTRAYLQLAPFNSPLAAAHFVFMLCATRAGDPEEGKQLVLQSLVATPGV